MRRLRSAPFPIYVPALVRKMAPDSDARVLDEMRIRTFCGGLTDDRVSRLTPEYTRVITQQF